MTGTSTVTIDTPLTLPNGLMLKNRLAKAAMTEGLADPSGRPSRELIQLYERWSSGGTGLLLTGNVLVDRRHLERPGNVVIDRTPDPTMKAGLTGWANVARSHGASLWVQLSHAGRQTPIAINPKPLAPSAVQLQLGRSGSFGLPSAMTLNDIAEVKQRFVDAAVAVRDAGFDGVQVHGAHGYLLSSFLSPRSNRRDDEWGGSLENRARLILQIVGSIRDATGPSFGISVKLNSADFQRGGFDIEDSVRVARWLDEAGIDLLEISGGNYEAPRMVDLQLDGNGKTGRSGSREAYFLEFAPRIKAALSRSALMVTGGFRSKEAMDSALANDGVDIIGIARPFCGLPDASRQLLSGRIPSLPAFEERLRLGPGILGPHSRVPLIRALNSAAVQAWFFEQMVRLGEGLEVAKDRSAFQALKDSKKRAADALERLDRSI